jgi:multiple sugar transport system substrate-binding protein
MNINQFYPRRSWRRYLLIAILGLLTTLWSGWMLGILPVLSQQPVTLTFLAGALDTQLWRPIIQQFEAQNPDIRINVVEGPNASNAVEDLYTTAFLLGSSPYDLVYLDIVWVPKFAAAGWLMDLSDRLSNAELSQFIEADVEGGRYQDRLYRVPVLSGAGMLFYRKDLLEKIGAEPPETFTDLVSTAQRIQSEGLAPWGYVWQGRQYEGLAAMFVEVLGGQGGFWVNPDTLEVGLDRPEAIQAVNFLLNTIQKGISPPGVTTYQEEESRRLFQNGEAVFLRNWPYIWPLANAEDSPIRGQVGLKPMVHAPGQSSASCMGSWGWGISKDTPHAEQAWRAIQFFSSNEALKQVTLDSGFLPARRSLYSDPQVVAKYPHFPAMLEVLDNGTLRPPIAQYAQASDILQRYLSAALTGRMTPTAAMQSAAAETRRLLGAS